MPQPPPTPVNPNLELELVCTQCRETNFATVATKATKPCDDCKAVGTLVTFAEDLANETRQPRHRRKGALLLSLLLLSAICQAQDAPKTPAPKTPKQFWALSSIYGLSIVADGETTVKMARYPGCYEGESPMLYGLHPERPRYYAVSGAIAAGSILLSRHLLRSRHRPLRVMAYALIAGETEDHTRGAIANARLDRAVCAENPSLNGGK
jgi:hypothetical protein